MLVERSAVDVFRCGLTGDGSVLHTLVLRPTVMYGELDPWYVVSGLQAAHSNGGILLPVGDGRARMQVSYAGNVAWAHLCFLVPLNKLAHLDTPVHFCTLMDHDTPWTWYTYGLGTPMDCWPWHTYASL